MGETFDDGGGGGGGGGGSSRRWLLEAAADDGAQHRQGGQWRRSRATSGYDSGGWRWLMAKIRDDKGGGNGGA